ILASDVSERALAHARRGAYAGRSLRALAPGFEAWLRVSGERASVAPELVERIRWRRINLVDPATLPAGRFHAVLCRNVLIYFAPETAAGGSEPPAACLPPDGVLLVGVSESLLSYGTLPHCQEREGTFFY